MLKKMCPKCQKQIDYNQRSCEGCNSYYEEAKKDTSKWYDAHNRDKQAKAFYNSQEWLRTREVVLSKYNSLDLYDLYANKKISYANTIHHIEELGEAQGKALDIDNLIPLTRSNHDKVHRMYKKNKSSTQRMLKDFKLRYEKG